MKSSRRFVTTCGQSTAEYAILAAVVVAALLAMQIYMKRGVQGKLREAADQVGEQFVPGKTTITNLLIHNKPTTRAELLSTTGEFSSTLSNDEIQERSGGKETVNTTGETKLF